MDWVKLLDDSNIEYVSRGKNTKRGEISVRCPFVVKMTHPTTLVSALKLTNGDAYVILNTGGITLTGWLPHCWGATLSVLESSSNNTTNLIQVT